MPRRLPTVADEFFRRHGQVYRSGRKVIVRAPGPLLLSPPDLECENPRAQPKNRIYRRVFKNREAFTPEEEIAATRILRPKNTLCFGATGYSTLRPRDLRAWHIDPEAYERSAEKCIVEISDRLNAEYDGLNLILVNGGTPKGIDLAVIRAALKRNLTQFSFSCAKYALYAPDDPIFGRIYIARTAREYSDAFIRYLQILLSVGGRQTALEHDIAASISYGTKLILFDLLTSISRQGDGPPARDAKGRIVDATKAFLQSLRIVGEGVRGVQGRGFRKRCSEVVEICVDDAQRIVEPGVGYSVRPLARSRLLAA